MNLFKKLADLFRSNKKEAVQALDNVIEHLDWAKKEIDEAEARLVDLAHRLHNGVVELETAAQVAKDSIERNQKILETANARKDDFLSKGQAVADLIDSMQSSIR